jgi:hypothetical protein
MNEKKKKGEKYIFKGNPHGLAAVHQKTKMH